MNKYTHYVSDYMINPTHKITVTLIGVGGNGTNALNDLAKIDYSLKQLGHPGLMVYVYDDDVVEQPNVGRQIFSESDIGNFKADVLTTRINHFYGLNWRCFPEKFTRHCDLSNIIITCVDNVDTRIMVGELIKLNKTTYEYYKTLYWLDFGNGKDYGQYILGSTEIPQPKDDENTCSKLPSILDLFPEMKEIEDVNEPSCSTAEALKKQDLFINSILVNQGMNLLWKLFTQYNLSFHGGFVNLKTGISKTLNI